MHKIFAVSKTPAALGAVALLLSACIPSVNPYHEPKDVTFEPALIGGWANDEKTWVFERHADEGSYELTIAESGKRGTLKATLFTLGDYRFLDVIPIFEDVELADDQADIIGRGVTSGHLVFHVAQTAPRLTLAPFEDEWFMNNLVKENGFLAHVAEDGRTLITAKTRELRRFLRRHIDEGRLFEDYTELTIQTGND